MKKINCKYYCEDYLLEGMCKLYLDWSLPMPIVAYCCNDEFCKHKKPITNFDRIKKTNKEELEELKVKLESGRLVELPCEDL